MPWLLNLLVRNVIEREIKRKKVQMKPPFEDFWNDLKEQIQSKLNLYISKKFYRNIVKQVCKSYFCRMIERKAYFFEFGKEPNSNLPLTFSHKISISTNHVWNFPFARKVLETFLIKSSRPHFRNSIWNSRKTGAKLAVDTIRELHQCCSFLQVFHWRKPNMRC